MSPSNISDIKSSLKKNDMFNTDNNIYSGNNNNLNMQPEKNMAMTSDNL
jgi:hypothetical protein